MNIIKAHEVGQDIQCASENTQLDYTPNSNVSAIPKNMLDVLIDLSYRVRGCHDLYGLRNINYFGDNEIRISEERFFATFESYVTEAGFFNGKFDKISSGHEGITFYTMRRVK